MDSFGKLARFLRQLAMIALIVMMTVTIIDISMRIFVNELVLGSVEIVQLALIAVVFLALPETFHRGEQITVDVLDQIVGPAAVRRLRRVAAVITVLLLAVMAIRTVPPAFDTLEIGDLTSDLQFSLFWYWIPVMVGVFAAAAAASLRLVALIRDQESPES